MHKKKRALSIILSLIALCCFSAQDLLAKTPNLSLEQMQQIVSKASEHAVQWNGPTSGPVGKTDMNIAIICEDLRNGGVLGVARGIREATQILHWKIKIFDAHGTAKGRKNKLDAAIEMKPDGVILIGSDAKNLETELSHFKEHGIPIVGWHVGEKAGILSSGSVAINVSTDPLEVAKITAMEAVIKSKGKAGVVIFTDHNFKIAMTKAKVMADIIRRCKGCTLLELYELPISKSAELMPKVIHQLLNKYGKQWTQALAINDIYFDYAIPELTKTDTNIQLYSAGDGSPSAFLRIKAGIFQYATVAEPLNMQGWQLVDELNRLLNDQPVSGYVTPVHLVTETNIKYDDEEKLSFDPDNGYKKIYHHIWKR